MIDENNQLPGTEVLHVVSGPNQNEQTLYFRDGRVVVWQPVLGTIDSTQRIPDDAAIAAKMEQNKSQRPFVGRA